MSQMSNPFEHRHDHGVEGAAGAGLPEVPADPAQRALADALRVSFAILKGLMLVLAVVYACSGLFSVKQTERAVQLRFGRIIGQKGPGWHAGLPFPIETVVKVDVSTRHLVLDKSFWFQLLPGEEGKPAGEIAGRALNPEKDGAMLTGDHSLVHARWLVAYQVYDSERYLRDVGSPAAAEALVRAAAEQGAVYAVAQLSADAVFRGQSNEEAATARAQKVLEDLDTGIRVTLTKQEFLFPASVRDAFQAVTNAQNNQRRKIDEAKAGAARQYSQAAGAAAEPLLDLVKRYDLAMLEHDQDQVSKLDALFRAAFLPRHDGGAALSLRTEGGQSYAISGDAAAIINQARADYNQVVKQTQVYQTVFNSLRPQYEHDPELVLSQLWQQARQEILTGDIEKYVLPEGQQPWFQINRDPALSRSRQEAALKASREQSGVKP
jgi:membrane protease subunit HflK